MSKPERDIFAIITGGVSDIFNEIAGQYPEAKEIAKNIEVLGDVFKAAERAGKKIVQDYSDKIMCESQGGSWDFEAAECDYSTL